MRCGGGEYDWMVTVFPKDVTPEGTERRSGRLCSDSHPSPLQIGISRAVGCKPPWPQRRKLALSSPT
jgi:hypothetical protein